MKQPSPLSTQATVRVDYFWLESDSADRDNSINHSP